VDFSGPCDEAEHANDPRCTGAERGDDDRHGRGADDDNGNRGSGDNDNDEDRSGSNSGRG
jgi:hypothetical protein